MDPRDPDCKSDEIDCKGDESDCKSDEIDCKNYEIDCKKNEIDCKKTKLIAKITKSIAKKRNWLQKLRNRSKNSINIFHKFDLNLININFEETNLKDISDIRKTKSNWKIIHIVNKIVIWRIYLEK